ncbi:hypothetical protein L6452_03466 [Arctium lappa]|uniref:Uncharacterized protein n=1 Tax=Arctium lappa TaxID=4217 RepID=A0ACB9FLR6_ARCLA|nr:hypothetical protein L6452_03466 [Arctium lappa]
MGLRIWTKFSTDSWRHGKDEAFDDEAFIGIKKIKLSTPQMIMSLSLCERKGCRNREMDDNEGMEMEMGKAPRIFSISFEKVPEMVPEEFKRSFEKVCRLPEECNRPLRKLPQISSFITINTDASHFSLTNTEEGYICSYDP